MGLLLTVILAACGTSSDEVESTVTREDVAGAPPTRTATSAEAESPGAPQAGTPGGEETPTTGNGEQPTGTTVEVDMADISYNPAELTIPANTDVTINLVNSGALEHTFDITDVVESGVIAGGGTGSVTVNLPAGTYEYWCAIPGHKDAGMVGTLTVAVATASASPEASPAASPEASPAAKLPTTYDVDMVDLAFEPAELTIPANVDVTINLTNSGALEHTLDVGDETSGTIAGGGTGKVVLNLAPGTYDFICAIPGHKDAGMVGTLTVVDDSGGAAGASNEPVALDMVELAFKPATLEIAANSDVTINLTNSGNLPHNFSIPSENISVDLAAGESTTFKLNLPAGTYDFDCNVPGHKDAGMVGKLTVK